MSWMKACALIVALFLLSGCSRSNNEKIELPLGGNVASVGPSEQTVYFPLLNTGRAWVDLSVPRPAQIDTPVDVVLLFDRTGSMGKFIHNSAKAARNLVNQVRGLAPDSRFAVATLADYYPSHTANEPASVPWKLQQGFTTDASALARSIETISTTDGGDFDEAYTTALYESARLPWRATARRFIVLLGDAYSHPVDPGPDGQDGTADDLRFEDALHELRNTNVAVLGIRAGDEDQSSRMFQNLAEQTGGSVSPLDSADDTARLVQASILSALLPKSKISPEGALASWVANIVSDDADSEGFQKFALNIAIPKGTKDGVFILPVNIRLNQGDLTQTGQVRVRLVVGWINHPFTPFIPILLLLALALVSMFRTLSKRSDWLYSVLSSGPFWGEAPAWMLALLEVLVWMSILMALVGLVLLFNPEWVPSEILQRVF